MRYSRSYLDPGHKMRKHHPTAPGVLSWITTLSTNPAQRCLNLVIKWEHVCPTWQDAFFILYCFDDAVCIVGKGDPIVTIKYPFGRTVSLLTWNPAIKWMFIIEHQSGIASGGTGEINDFSFARLLYIMGHRSELRGAPYPFGQKVVPLYSFKKISY
jgi:hypothetical protein